jgi:hypothetical protein
MAPDVVPTRPRGIREAVQEARASVPQPTGRAGELPWRKGERDMGKNERRMPRKPATKFPNLRKKLQKGKIQSRQAKKK